LRSKTGICCVLSQINCLVGTVTVTETTCFGTLLLGHEYLRYY
jgi:hypothetical protein